MEARRTTVTLKKSKWILFSGLLRASITSEQKKKPSVHSSQIFHLRATCSSNGPFIQNWDVATCSCLSPGSGRFSFLRLTLINSLLADSHRNSLVSHRRAAAVKINITAAFRNVGLEGKRSLLVSQMRLDPRASEAVGLSWAVGKKGNPQKPEMSFYK